MNIYLKKDIEEGVQFLLPEFLKDQEKKHLYAKIKKHMSSLSEDDAKIFLQQITKNKFLDVLKLEVKLVDLYS